MGGVGGGVSMKRTASGRARAPVPVAAGQRTLSSFFQKPVHPPSAHVVDDDDASGLDAGTEATGIEDAGMGVDVDVAVDVDVDVDDDDDDGVGFGVGGEAGFASGASARRRHVERWATRARGPGMRGPAHAVASASASASGGDAGGGRSVLARVLPGEKLTPLEAQVVGLKAEHPGALLAVETGYKYRFFGEDAAAASATLSLVAHVDHAFLTCSIPTHRLHVHVRRLCEAGFKVGVVRQAETARIKAADAATARGPFRRELQGMYTRATLEAGADLGGGPLEMVRSGAADGRFIACVVEGREPADAGRVEVGVCCVDVGTGEVLFDAMVDGEDRPGLEARLLAVNPEEILLAAPRASEATERLVANLRVGGALGASRVERVAVPCGEPAGGDPPPAAVARLSGHLAADRGVAGGDVSGLVETVRETIGHPLALEALARCCDHLAAFGLAAPLLHAIACSPDTSIASLSTRRGSAAGAGAPLFVGPTAFRQLDLLDALDGGKHGSLLWLLDHCATAFGKRQLRRWVTSPLRDPAAIRARLDAVAYLRDLRGLRASSSATGAFNAATHVLGGALPSVLSSLADVDRGLQRIHGARSTPGEVVSILRSLRRVADAVGNDLAAILEALPQNQPLLRGLVADVPAGLAAKLRDLLSHLNEDVAALDRGSGGDRLGEVFADDQLGAHFPALLAAKEAVSAAEEALHAELLALRRTLGMPRLEYASVSGVEYLVELPFARHAPSRDWVQVSSTKKVTRYHPPQVERGYSQLLLRREQVHVEAKRAWDAFLLSLRAEYPEWRALVKTLATLDCLYSLARVANNPGYVMPAVVAAEGEGGGAGLEIVDGRHPVLDVTLGTGFVPNSCSLRPGSSLVITGPNMGGKSSFVRAVALLVILAQIGSFVPCASMRLVPFDQVHCRMGAGDDLARGQSTFFRELSETGVILEASCTCDEGSADAAADVSPPRCLVVLDELGRGTATHDGTALAVATLDHLVTHAPNTNCFFVTHYPEVADVARRRPDKVAAVYVSFLGDDGPDDGSPPATVAGQDVTLLYKLVPGIANRSFGLSVARRADLPDTVQRSAARRAAAMESDARLGASRRALRAILGSSLPWREARELARRFLQRFPAGDEDTQ